MRYLLCVLMLGVCLQGWSADLVKNADFALETPGQPKVPADWVLPKDGSWQRVLGADGKAFLQYEAAGGVRAPARGTCDFLTPKSGYTVEVTYEGDGVLTPLLRMMDLTSNQPLARAVGSVKPGLQTMGVTFSTVTANVAVELYADAAQAEAKPAPAGRLRILKVALFATGDEAREKLPEVGPNLALGKPYTMDPAPNYGDCADPDDAVQATDGVYTEGHFWTRKSTVGWVGVSPTITLDLGQDQPIKGLSYHTAAGVADVHWPRRFLVFVSPDGQQWYRVGDLMKLNEPHRNLPAYGQYALRHIWTDALNTHGRYVALYVEPPHGTFTLVDEIEVWGGGQELLSKPYAGPPWVGSLKENLGKLLLSDLIRQQFQQELVAVDGAIAALPPEQKAKFAAEAAALTARTDAWEAPDMAGFRAVLPVDALETDIFRCLASVWRAQKKPVLRVWNMPRWEKLDAFAEPRNGTALQPVTVHLMNNESRAGTINLTNADSKPLRVRVRVTGLPGGDNPSYLKVLEVLTVGTRHFVPVSAALPDAARDGKDYVITVPSGMTRQVWLSFKPENLAAKTHAGQIEISPTLGPKQTVPLKVVVYPLRFPDQT
ncbi:MAG: discoidin domain-containing protein, partial [Armatimonadota bacterium]